MNIHLPLLLSSALPRPSMLVNTGEVSRAVVTKEILFV